MPAHACNTAELSFFAELENIALEATDRPSRACRAARRIRDAWALGHVGLFDVVDGDFQLVGDSGDGSVRDAQPEADVVVPVNSLDGDLIGALEVHARRGARIRARERLQMQACAGVLWWLWRR